MIEISHGQAKRLVSAQIDELKLPEEQWAALHAHLENCPECSAFRDQLRKSERDFRRGMRDRWLTVDGPDPATGEIILAARGATLAWRGAFRKAGAGVLALVLLLMAWMGWQSQSSDRQQAFVPEQATATPIPTPTATPIPTYRGQIVYEAPGAGGKMDIFLLNSGVDPVNLTEDPAVDISPAWSPDGEWLAFLSDRSGKLEIWIMHISGARLTQITSDPEVDWLGPISWSPDGQILTLIGQRELKGDNKDEYSPILLESQVFLVPLDGSSGPVALGSTRGASHVAFSPGEEPRLAFAGQEEWSGAPVVYYFNEKRFVPIDKTTFASVQRRVSALAWSLTGERLLYQSDGPFLDSLPVKNAASVLRVVDFRIGNSGVVTASSKFLSENMPLGVVSAPGWTGIKDEYSFLMQFSEDCSNLILNSVGRQLRVFGEPINEMCVEGAPPLNNWRSTNKSVVVKARRPGESIPGLYVLGFPGSGFTEERLIDLDPAAGSVQLRPQGYRVLAIDPTPARTPPQPPPADPPGEAYGEILFTTKSGDRTFIEAMRPDGTGRRLINQSIGYNGCPVWSPDRTHIAFYSDRDGLEDIGIIGYVMDSTGLNVRQTTFSTRTPPACPLWSPDSSTFMVAFTSGDVCLFSADPEQEDGWSSCFQSDPDYPAPIWLPDGRLMAFSRSGDLSGIIAVAGEVQKSLYFRIHNIREVFPTELFSIVGSLAEFQHDFSESGESMIFTMLHSRSETTTATLNLVNLDNGMRTVLPNLSTGDELLPYPQSIKRLPDGNVVMVYQGHVDSQFKTAVYIYDLQSGEQRWLARLTDALLDARWSADGRYVLLNTGSGLWALDIPAAQRGEAGPVWIADIGSDPFSWED